ncbi:hypothetical protein PYW07_006664 [Mythimna separata]|uniref:DUF4817 domain-containing protein n=1 Tax=Mythimna separata TaxID=271217 RepID=A0AAD7YV99_MYTSE|nr:hypothetical protein PYW07_006664 [Mythimna separata]
MPRYEYTPREYAEMHFIYGEARGNARAAARLYLERYPNRDRHPDFRVFIRVHNALLDGRILGTGVGGASEGRPAQVNDEIIIREIEEDSSVSIRVIAQRTDPYITSLRKPYVRNVKELEDEALSLLNVAPESEPTFTDFDPEVV